MTIDSHFLQLKSPRGLKMSIDGSCVRVTRRQYFPQDALTKLSRLVRLWPAVQQRTHGGDTCPMKLARPVADRAQRWALPSQARSPQKGRSGRFSGHSPPGSSSDSYCWRQPSLGGQNSVAAGSLLLLSGGFPLWAALLPDERTPTPNGGTHPSATFASSGSSPESGHGLDGTSGRRL